MNISKRLNDLENRLQPGKPEPKSYIVTQDGDRLRLTIPGGERDITQAEFEALEAECHQTGGLMILVVYSDQYIRQD